MDYSTTRTIAAPPSDVWSILADLTEWPTWTDSMTWVRPEGDDPPGEGSRVRLKQPRLPTSEFVITEWRPGREFTWRSHSPGVTSTARHLLEPEGEGTRLTLDFAQSGPLSGLLWLIGGSLVRRYVEMEADGLRTRAERTPPSAGA